MKKIKLLLTICAFFIGGSNVAVNAQASYNHTYKDGVTVAAGTDYFLYNIGAKQFLTSGLNYGTRATVDNSGRVLTLSENGTGYNIRTDFVSLNNREEGDRKAGFLTTNGYVDTGTSDAAWKFTPVELAGYTNVYTIKNSDSQYLFFDAANEDPGCPVNVGASTGDNYSYWLLISKAAREAVGDYTHYLINTQMNAAWEFKTWSGSKVWNDYAIIQPGGNLKNRCGEKYHAVVDIYQNIKETVPNGRYKFFAQGFWRQDGTAAGPVLYANSNQKTLLTKTGPEDSMTDASNSFSGGNYVNEVETFVSDGNLKVGINITDGSQWVIFDNFVLDYLGQCVMDYATELPDGGAMAADTWYYFDIAVAGDNYNATADDLSAIICTTDGYKLTSAVSGDVSLTATDNSLSVTRYYVKSVGKANTLAVAAASYTYTVGSPTLSIADGAYTNNSLSTFTFTFSEVATNDPGASFAILNGSAKASLKKGGVQQAEGTLSLAGNVLTATFNETLDFSSTYTIEIASGVVGYDGHETNAAISTTIKTGLIADGVYYFKKYGAYKYLTRGGNYGTEAVVDNFGLSFQAILQADGSYYFKNVDHSLSANADKYLNAYTDQGAFKWNLETSTNGYYLKYGEGGNLGKYVGTNEDPTYHYNYQNAKADKADAIEWVLLSKAEYAADLVTAKNAQAAAIATAAGKTAATVAELEAVLASDFGTTDMTSSIQGAALKTADDMAKWTQVQYVGNVHKNADANGVCGEIWNSCGGVKQDITGLSEGIYKVTVHATWRPGNQAAGKRVGAEANTTAWMYATTATQSNITQLKQWHSGDPEVSSRQSFVDAGDMYLNTTYVYVSEGQTLTIGLAAPAYCVEPWFPFYGWSLTYYEAKATASEKTALANAITTAEAKALGFETGEYAPYNNVDALTKLAAAKAINPEAASGKDVVAATTALTGATWTANVAEVSAINLEAIYDPANKDGSNRLFAPGWDKSGGSDAYNTRLVQGTTGNAGMAAVDNELALFTKFGTTYGEEQGYTMPLKANTLYKLSFKFGAWGENKKIVSHLSVIDGESNVIAVTPESFTRENNSGLANENTAAWFDYAGYFKTNAAGDYVLRLTKDDNGEQRQIVMGNIVLKKAVAENITIAEDADYTPAYNYANVTLTRTLSNTNWNTFVVPFDIDNATLTTKFGTVEVAEYSETADGDNSTINFNKMATPAITANVPVLLKTSTAPASVTFNNVLIKTNEAKVAGTNYDFVGTYAASATIAADDYFIGSNKLWKSTGATTIKGTRAYIKAKTAAARIAGFAIDGEETTAINGITISKDNAPIYNLNGQRVAKPAKGMYVKNGKKVVMK